MTKNILVLGHNGMVGKSICRNLKDKGYNVYTHNADLRSQDQVGFVFGIGIKYDYIFVCAAKVGGILANSTSPVEFLYDNTMIAMNVIHMAHKCDIQNLMFLGSSCIYPKFAPQPIKEEHLLTGLLEPTNEAYAIAKIAGIKLCEAYKKQHGRNYVPVMPTNLFGIGDNFDLKNSHVLPALIRKAHEAKTKKAKHMEVWGSGNPRREFLYVDDLADACIFLMETGYSNGLINIGSGEDYTIKDIAEMVCKIVMYDGSIEFDTSKPDGTPQKLLDISKLKNLGWEKKTTLIDGIKKTYDNFLKTYISYEEIL